MKISTSIVVALLVCATASFAQKTWTGSGGDGLWATPANWSGGTAPISTDQVLLDNSTFAGSYTVTLPGGTGNTVVARISITPTGGNTITLFLPSSSTNNPGLTVGDAASTVLYDLVINSGGIVKNSSGASAGAGIVFASTSLDSLYIANGGRYIHNTTRANSTIVSQNAKVPGTENGTFEFDAPAGATYNLTLSGRVYGNLMMSSTAASGTRTYGGSGTTALLIRGTLTIGDGVTYVSTQTGALNLWGNLTCNGTGSFSAVSQAVNFTGTTPQTVTSITRVPFAKDTVNNATGVTFNADATVTGNLQLTNGILTLVNNSLTALSPITGGSASSYIATTGTGKLRGYVAASTVVYPVGTGSTYNPVTLNNTGGTADTFAVSVKSTFDNPPSIPAAVVNRQWTIAEDITGGTNLAITLQWNSADQAAGFSTGSALYVGRHTGTGWVQTAATLAGSDPFTASASGFTDLSPFGVGNAGALPVQLSSFTGSVVGVHQVRLNWSTATEVNNYGFFVERRTSGQSSFSDTPDNFVQGHGTTLDPQHYLFMDADASSGQTFYRLRQIDLDGTTHYSDPVSVTQGVSDVTETAQGVFALSQNYPNPFNPETVIKFSVETSARTTLEVYNILGQKVATLFNDVAEAGQYYNIRLNGTALASGMYIYRLQSGTRIDVKKMLLLK